MNLVEGRCNHFVTRKKRMCRMSVRTGALYCGEHEPKIEDDNEIKKNSTRLRMTCPLDPKHTCYISKLEKHLKVCNAKQGEFPSYIKKNCNINGDNNTQNIAIAEDGSRRSLANVSDEILTQVVAIVEKIYDGIINGNISTHKEQECHPIVSCDLDTDGRGDNTRRHLLQTSSLIHILEDQGLVHENTCFVELGAGKGHLSYYLSKAVNHVPQCSVLLVDRASHRHKQDNKLRLDTAVIVERIRADISDLVLSQVKTVQNSKSLVAVSKHLCGVATDLALNCITKEDVLDKATGVVMATCCHHRCSWDSFAGRPFLEEQNITHSQFDVICGLVSWATCGSGLSRERRAQISGSKLAKKAKYDSSSQDGVKHTNKNELGLSKVPEKLGENDKKDDRKGRNSGDENFHTPDELGNNNDYENDGSIESLSNEKCNMSLTKNLGLSFDQREEIGCKAKAVLDWGRLLYLRGKKFDANLCFYVDKKLSPENVCIVAKKIQS